MKLANQKFEEFISEKIKEPKLKAAKEKKISNDKKIAEEKIINDKQLAEEKIIKDKQLAKEKKLRDKQLAKEKMSNEIKKWWESFQYLYFFLARDRIPKNKELKNQSIVNIIQIMIGYAIPASIKLIPVMKYPSP